MSVLELEAIVHDYGSARVLDGVSLRVEDGEFFVLLGRSGSGKSTLLRIAAGLVAPTSGEVRLSGVRVNEKEPVERDVAMVFQSYALYPHLSVRENLAFPLRVRRQSRSQIDAAVGEAAELLGLGALLDRKPSQLSGGQMQRVALGRAIVRRPRLYLFDEPLSNLDARMRLDLRAEIARLFALTPTTALYVTHDQAEAMTLGARIGILEGGRLVQVGRPIDVFAHPASAFVATFVGSPPMNLLASRVAGGVARAGTLELPIAGVEEGRPILLGVRPHEIALTGPLLARIVRVERHGSHTIAGLDLGGAPLCASWRGDVHQDGTTVGIAIAGAAWHVFDAASGARIEAALVGGGRG